MNSVDSEMRRACRCVAERIEALGTSNPRTVSRFAVSILARERTELDVLEQRAWAMAAILGYPPTADDVDNGLLGSCSRP